MHWHHATGVLSLDRPRLIGIINVTPDSFSDGGAFASPAHALEHAVKLVEDGADVLEVGGESTRPGATSVSADDEIRRTADVVAAIRVKLPGIPIAIDTVKGSVARAALDAGASIVNDVSGLRLDPALGGLCAERSAGLVLMHSRGDVAEMATYREARYGSDVVGEVIEELRESVVRAREAGVEESRIVIDPGIGFSKRREQSLAVLRQVDRFTALGFPVLIGASRKRFIGELSAVNEPAARVSGTIAANVLALARGVRLFRVHDVRPNREALAVASAILGVPGPQA